MKAKLHFSPEKNWMNDPNGLVYYKGEYHLFFQYFPYDTVWGTMHWGHASSTDLISWKQHDIALYPSVDADKNGCFSGSAIVVDDDLVITYTGVNYNNTMDDNIHNHGDKGFVSKQLLIRTNDAYDLNKNKEKLVIVDQIDDISIGDKMHIRDPKIWKHEEDYYICLGTKVKNEHDEYIGKILIYKSKDLKSFNLVSEFSSGFVGNMWECPDYFTIDDRGLIIMSPEQMTLDKKNYTNNSVICKAEYNYKTNEFFIEQKYDYLDYGLDLYAPQTFVDKDGNRVLFGWIRMPKPVDGSIGMQTLPRVINYTDGEIKYHLHSNVYKNIKEIKSYNLAKNSYYILTSISKGDSYNIGGLVIGHKGYIEVNRSNIFETSEMIGTILNTPSVNKECKLEVVLDINVIEIFIDEGRYVITLVIDEFENIIEISQKYELKTWELK